MTNSSAIVLPWSGPRPWYWDLWRQSAAGLPFDIITIEKPLSYFQELITTKLRSSVSQCFPEGASNFQPSTFNIQLSSSYKLCDFKPLYGELFADELADYDYWAFGDCDVLYGSRLASWLAKVLEGQYDVATVKADYCAGPFTLIRNTPRMNRLWREVQDWERLLGARQVMAFDELGPNWFRKHIYGGMSYAQLRESQDSFSALVWREASAGRLKLLAEPLIDEHPLKRGEIVPLRGDYALYHLISAKLQFGFSRVERGEQAGVGLSRGKAVRDAFRFACSLLSTSYSLLPTFQLSRPWARVSECVARKCGCKTWWHNYPWNNR